MKLSDQITRRHLFVAFGTSSQSGTLSSVDLAATRDDVSVALSASDGSVAPIAGADTSTAGVMTATDKAKLDSLPPASARVFGAFLDIPGAAVGAGISHLRTGGYAVTGDGGHALYRRAGAEPSHALKVQSADGAWWELVPEQGVINVLQAGAKGDGTTDDTVAINNALAYGQVTVHFPATANHYAISGGLMVPDDTTVTGDGFNSEVRQTAQGANVFELGHDCAVRGLHVKMIDGNNLDLTKQNAVWISGKNNVTVENNWLELADIAVSGVQIRASNQVTVRGNIIYKGQWSSGSGPAASAADIVLYSGTEGRRNIIDGNYCFSNNSGGMFLNALGKDADLIVTNNICVTLDPATCTQGGTWSEIASGGQRRHGITISYNDGANGSPRAVVEGNLCRNTRWTGIYKQGESLGAVIISNNVCTLNGYDTTEGLGGGISVEQSGRELITGNFIDAFQGTSPGAGAIAVRGSTGTRDVKHPTVVSANVVRGSAGFGLTLSTNSAGVQVEGNTFIGNVNNDILTNPTPSVADNGGHRIVRNRITREIGSTISGINHVPQNSTLITVIEGNDIIGNDNTTVDDKNAGIAFTGKIGFTHVRHNRVQGFYYGIHARSFQTTDREAVIEGNVLVDCDRGIGMGASDGDQTVPLVDNRFVSINGSNISNSGGYPCAWLAQRIGGKLIVEEATGAPSKGAWERGDKAFYTDASAGGKIGAVCVTAGTPGTWKEWGAIDA